MPTVSRRDTCPLDPDDLVHDAIARFLGSSNPEYKRSVTFDRISGLLFGFLRKHAVNLVRRRARRNAWAAHRLKEAAAPVG
jgi:DNA-directed RNA polymerase specialized sigma24 family protein